MREANLRWSHAGLGDVLRMFDGDLLGARNSEVIILKVL
jgi:hypothetical protein